MSEVKAGEQVHLGIKQIDADDKVIMDLDVRWYGYENEYANKVVNDMIDAIQERTLHYSESKNAR